MELSYVNGWRLVSEKLLIRSGMAHWAYAVMSIQLYCYYKYLSYGPQGRVIFVESEQQPADQPALPRSLIITLVIRNPKV